VKLIHSWTRSLQGLNLIDMV